jgi:hypothetical protein
MSIPDAIEYVFASVGIDEADSIPDASEQVLANVGIVSEDSLPAGVESVYVGDVNTDTPTPHIWWLMPNAGRPGDGFNIVGHGFGTDQSTYDGSVEMEIATIWGAISVTDWDLVAAGTHAYDDDREMNFETGVITMEHGVIAVVVPIDAVPPGSLVRVVTDGP